MNKLYRAKFLINLARKKYPLPVSYRGRLTEEELEELRKYCRVNTPAVFMSGECLFVIRIEKNERKKEVEYA